MKRLLAFTVSLLLTVPAVFAQRNSVTSVLEIMDVNTGKRTVVKEFPALIEAPNWTSDGKWLVYNSGGKLYKISPVLRSRSRSIPALPPVVTTTT